MTRLLQVLAIASTLSQSMAYASPATPEKLYKSLRLNATFKAV